MEFDRSPVSRGLPKPILIDKVRCGRSRLQGERHQALRPTVDCLVGHELTHDALDRYCNGIVHAQKNDIDDMRELLCRQFGICDFQPFQRRHVEQGITDDTNQ